MSSDEVVQPKILRKRAKKACLACRKRKVRCDVSQRGSPCMNCFLDGDDCVVPQRANRPSRDIASRLIYCHQASSLPSPSSPLEATQRQRNGQKGDQIKYNNVGEALPEIRLRIPEDQAAHDPPSEATRSEPASLITPPSSLNTPHQDSNQLNDGRTPRDGLTLISEANAWTRFQTYGFISLDSPSDVATSAAQYLDAQGCFEVPTRGLMNEIVRQYFRCVHPLLPLLDEGRFWRLYYSSGPEEDTAEAGSLSLLVFQAMTFAACSFISDNLVLKLGFPNRKAARTALYRKAKLLHNFEFSSSPIDLSQAALLMSYWATTSQPTTKRCNTKWLSIAIHHAKTAEAHNYAAFEDSPGQPTRSILKRLWWCCIIRDRILPLCCRRSIQITHHTFDFEAHPPLTAEDLESEIKHSVVYNETTKQQLAMILELTLKLCVQMTDVLLMAYPLHDPPNGRRWVLSEETPKLQDCRFQLRRWNREAMNRIHKYGTISSGLGSHESVVFYKDLMFMYYHTARAALCNHELRLFTDPNVNFFATGTFNQEPVFSCQDVQRICEGQYELKDSVQATTDCLVNLYAHGLLHWLPISAIACTALPLILHVLDAKVFPQEASSYRPRSTSLNQLRVILEVMMACQDQYDAVEFVGQTARYIIQMAQARNTVEKQSRSGGNETSWTDLLETNPDYYMRLVLTMDLSLSKDRLPDESEHSTGWACKDAEPPSLFVRSMPITSILTPELLETPASDSEDQTNSGLLAGQTTDFIDPRESIMLDAYLTDNTSTYCEAGPVLTILSQESYLDIGNPPHNPSPASSDTPQTTSTSVTTPLSFEHEDNSWDPLTWFP